MIADLSAETDAAWVTLATSAGLDPNAFRVTSDWLRDDPKRAATIRLYSRDAGPSVVLKHIRRTIDTDSFLALVTAQRSMADMMQGTDLVPAVLAVDPARRSFLMDAARGRTVFNLIEGSDDHRDHLRRAGQWICAFHTAGFDERRIFNPGFNRKQILRLAEQVNTGAKDVAHRSAFCRFATAAAQDIEQFSGAETVSSRIHGDMNLRNILIDGDTAWGIDITQTSTTPVGYDIARFLLHYTALMADLDTLAPGHIVPEPALHAFFEGYKLVGPDDPSVQTLLRIRMLNDWARLPAKRWQRSLMENFRLTRLRRMANSAFGK